MDTQDVVVDRASRRSSEVKMRRKLPKPGEVFSIPLPSGGFAFGQEIYYYLTAFFAHRSDKLLPVEDIVKLPVAFVLLVDRRPFRVEGWQILGPAHLDEKFKTPPFFFRQDAINKKLFRYDVRDKTETPISIQDATKLECIACWAGVHVVTRLEDLFAGRPNISVETMKPKAVPPLKVAPKTRK